MKEIAMRVKHIKCYRKIKRRKWYPISVIPDVEIGLIAMTDMGYIFEAAYTPRNKWECSVVKNNKVYFEPAGESFVKWMKL